MRRRTLSPSVALLRIAAETDVLVGHTKAAALIGPMDVVAVGVGDGTGTDRDEEWPPLHAASAMAPMQIAASARDG